MFWPVVNTSLAVSAATFVVVYGYWRWWPNRRHKRRVKDMAAMRDQLVHHVNDLDDIMDKLQHGTCEYASWQHRELSCWQFVALQIPHLWVVCLRCSDKLQCAGLCIPAYPAAADLVAVAHLELMMCCLQRGSIALSVVVHAADKKARADDQHRACW